MSQPKPKPTQWHPLFAELLRPLLQDHYEVLTNVPVGDAPRAADILLVRRTSDEPTPFRGLWRHLTNWNVVEFKGPTVSARIGDLHRLVELGLGIHRRLNEEQHRQSNALLEPDQTAFWYIAPRLGSRFLPLARQLFGAVEEIEAGLWRSQVMRHLVFLVSSETFASEPDSVPLHLLFQRSPDKERELARLIAETRQFWDWYAWALRRMHPLGWKEVKDMPTTKRKKSQSEFVARVEKIGIENLIKMIGAPVDAVPVEAGAREIIDAIGPEKFVDEVSDWLLANLPPAQLKKLKERLK